MTTPVLPFATLPSLVEDSFGGRDMFLLRVLVESAVTSIFPLTICALKECKGDGAGASSVVRSV